MPNSRRSEEGDPRSQVLEVLLDKVRADPYPSSTHLDMVESMLAQDDVQQYAEALLDKVRGDSFPSLDHLRRLQALT